MINFYRGANHPQIKLWYRSEEVLIKKAFHLTHKENQDRKPKKYYENQGSCDSQFKYCETVCIKILHREVIGTVQKLI